MGVFSFGNFFLESKFPQLATVQANKVGIAFIIWLRLSILFYNFIASFILTPSTSIFLIHSQHKQRDHYLHSCQIETAMSLDSNVLCHLKDIRFFHCRKKTVFMRLEGELVPGYLFSTCDPPLLQWLPRDTELRLQSQFVNVSWAIRSLVLRKSANRWSDSLRKFTGRVEGSFSLTFATIAEWWKRFPS